VYERDIQDAASMAILPYNPTIMYRKCQDLLSSPLRNRFVEAGNTRERRKKKKRKEKPFLEPMFPSKSLLL
jgi:hypothetical protein